METVIYKIDSKEPEEKYIREAGKIIQAGGLVAFPTETVYGLGGNALDPSASKKIYAAKGRPSDNPLIAHIADGEMLEELAAGVPENAKLLMDAFWPGPLTMIFKKKTSVPYETTGGLDTVAVRMPAHAGALALIRAAGVPIAAPSANASGRPSPTCAAHVEEDLFGKIDMILDGGHSDIGVESTIVDLTGEIPCILRPGYITEEMLQEVVGEVCMDPTLMDGNSKERPKAPGMRYRHYAPKAPMTLYVAETIDAEGDIAKFILEDALKALTGQSRVGIIATKENMATYETALSVYAYEGKCRIKCIGSRKEPDGVARNLYGILREFDADRVDAIYAEGFETDHLGQAIMNRLLKAAGHQVKTVPWVH